MPPVTRREFLEGSLALTGAALWSQVAGGAPPSEKVNIAILGSGRGAGLADQFARLPECNVVAICDIDESRGQPLAQKISDQTGRRTAWVNDFRTLLDQKDVDAIAIATPDHWHAPITIRACVAGKDVYVEKPASHNIVEGRLAVKAARKHNRIVQHGTNLRGATHYQEAWDLLKKGEIGKVLMVKAINNQRRGRMEARPDEPVPSGVDYDLWLGPAAQRPFNRNRFHGGWHWHWDYGTGDMGNDGVHQVDLGRWALGLKAPNAVSCSGAKLGSRGDAQETPDTLIVTWEYDDLLYVFEQRDFTPYQMPGHRNENDNIFYGDKGFLMIDRDGYKVFHERGKPGAVVENKFNDSPRHFQNFVDCVKSRQREQLLADIEEGHYSAMLCHLGNIAYRTGRRLEFDGTSETFPKDKEANQLLGREYRKGFELAAI
ncbi:MAG: Gfo/Idh/MocA family oxidoreductase [Planctomycetaceae bacterium]|nr:Gfo/Idh/MocA family oxidoreductase [Planctomycetaceae bacterium]